MEPITRQIHLPGLYLVAIISLEISGYFLYLFYKKRKEKIFLNKLLLAYGLLIGIGFTSIVIRLISNYYNEDVDSNVLINNIMHISITIATLIYMFLASTKDFDKIIQNKICKIITLITTILSIFIVLSPSTDLRVIFITIALMVALSFMVIFQFRLIFATTGVIRKRLIVISSGATLTLGTIVFSANEFMTYQSQQNEITLLLSTPLMMAGLIIIFFGSYDFPVFLEFNWKSELINLYIMEQKFHNQLFKYDFTKHQQTFNPEYLPGGLLGIEKIISAVTDTPEKKIHRIEQKGLIFIILRSESVIYTLVVKKEMRSVHFFLESVMGRFENLYKSIIKDLNLIRGREDIYFVGFETELNEILEQ